MSLLTGPWLAGHQVHVQRLDQGAHGLLVPLDHPVGLALQARRHLGGEPLVLGAVGAFVLLAAKVGADRLADDAGQVLFARLRQIAQRREFPLAQAQGDKPRRGRQLRSSLNRHLPTGQDRCVAGVTALIAPLDARIFRMRSRSGSRAC
jgi:hypothetical protein